jgi:hypothetical protein
MGNRSYLMMLAAVVVTVIVGVTMAATGFSADSFAALALVAVGVGLAISTARYRRNPVYTDASGQTRTAGPGTLLFMLALGILLLACGVYVGIYGIPK